MEANNAARLVEVAARDIEKLLSNRSKALVVSKKWTPAFKKVFVYILFLFFKKIFMLYEVPLQFCYM